MLLTSATATHLPTRRIAIRVMCVLFLSLFKSMVHPTSRIHKTASRSHISPCHRKIFKEHEHLCTLSVSPLLSFRTPNVHSAAMNNDCILSSAYLISCSLSHLLSLWRNTKHLEQNEDSNRCYKKLRNVSSLHIAALCRYCMPMYYGQVSCGCGVPLAVRASVCLSESENRCDERYTTSGVAP
jgi:hypothetical protein